MNYIEHLLTLVSTSTGCVSISVFISLCGIPVDITSSAVVLKSCLITAGIKKFNLRIKKKKKKRDKMIFLAKTKLNSIDFSISKAIIDLNISHDEFILENNVLKEFDNTKDEIKNSYDKEILMIKKLNDLLKTLNYI